MNSIKSEVKEIVRGGIYWVDFGTRTGSEQSGLRPAVCISNEKNNKFSTTYNFIPVSTRLKRKNLPVHFIVQSCIRPSLVLTEQIQTVSKENVRNFVSMLSEEEMVSVEKCLRIQLGLAI